MSSSFGARLAARGSILPLIAITALTGCGEPYEVVVEDTASLSPGADTFPATFARQWMVNLANSVKGDKISPPVAARTYSYGAIALYESVVHGMPGYQSLAGQLNGLSALPEPVPGVEYDWPTVMAATMATFVPAMYVWPERLFFEMTTMTQASLTSLGPMQIGFRQVDGVSPQVIADSVAYGEALGGALAGWAASDGYAEARYKGYISPEGPQYWVPTGFSDTDKVMNPLEPWFGSVRPLVLTTGDECAPPAPVAFSTAVGSDMYNQANAVYQTDQASTPAQREIARFWADGPGDTATPPGHWLAIATKFVRNTNLAEAAAGYAYTSLAYLDAFIAVWQSKYTHNLLRPETYIRRHINGGWRPFLPTPQFPEYVSGHSGVSGASAVTFTQQFGAVPYTDDTKIRRGFAARSFTSFSDAAQEAASSRLYGGIHYPMANANGLSLGACVGGKILDRVSLQP